MSVKRSVSFADDIAPYVTSLPNASAYVNRLIREDLIKKELDAAAAARTAADQAFDDDAAAAAAMMWDAE